MADICDFCSSPNVVKRFGCRDFKAASEDAGVICPSTRDTNWPTNLVFSSHDYWAACPACAGLVEARDVSALVKHVLEEYEKQERRKHAQRHRLEKHLKLTYELFFDNWTGGTETVNRDSPESGLVAN